MNDEPLEESVVLRTEMAEIKPTMLYVNVDFNMLLADCGEKRAWEMIGKLKDLLG